MQTTKSWRRPSKAAFTHTSTAMAPILQEAKLYDREGGDGQGETSLELCAKVMGIDYTIENVPQLPKISGKSKSYRRGVGTP